MITPTLFLFALWLGLELTGAFILVGIAYWTYQFVTRLAKKIKAKKVGK